MVYCREVTQKSATVVIDDWTDEFVIAHAWPEQLQGWTVVLAVDRNERIVDLRFSVGEDEACELTARNLRSVPIDRVRRQVLSEMQRMSSQRRREPFDVDVELMTSIQSKIAQLPDVGASIRAWSDERDRHVSALLTDAVEWRESGRLKPGRKRSQSDSELAMMALEYVRACVHHNPNERLKPIWNRSQRGVTEMVYRLRAWGFLGPTRGRGRSGGHLTPMAIELLYGPDPVNVAAATAELARQASESSAWKVNARRANRGDGHPARDGDSC